MWTRRSVLTVISTPSPPPTMPERSGSNLARFRRVEAKSEIERAG